MTTLTDYAQISGRVYQRTDENRMYRPSGFTEVQWVRDNPITGFSAGVYKKGDEIVIGFTGTNEGMSLDFIMANIPAGAGFGSPQIRQAATLVLKVMADNPGATISFTGHSLGGGLASVMAVLFNKDATIFDPAPFEPSVRSGSTLASLQADLSLTGYSNGDLNAYFLSAGLLFSERENRVSSWYVDGEILVPLRTVGGSIVGDGRETKLTVGTPTASGTDLHSITLLHALLVSPSFKTAISAKPYALEQFFSSQLYAQKPQTANKTDFLTKLLLRHIGNTDAGIPPNNVLDRLADDLNRIGATGVTANAHWQKALTVVAMDYYYKDADNATPIFKLESGGLHFNLDDIGVSTLKSLTLLRTAASSTAIGGDPFNVGNVSGAKGWHVQTGEGSMYWTASKDADDVAIGGAQGDVLRAGSGSDYLVGGAGDDLLDGGVGYDTLLGGEGDDTYDFKTGETNDTIVDSDGIGKIMVDGMQLTGGKKKADNSWISDDKVWGYLLTSGGDLVITRGSSLDRIVVQGWQSAGGNKLGLNLQDVPVATPPATPGTFSSPGHADGDKLEFPEFWGNSSGTFTVDGADYDRLDLASLTGNDLLGGFINADRLDGGAGADVIFGGLGADQIDGGADNDVILANITGYAPHFNWSAWDHLYTPYPDLSAWTSGSTLDYVESGFQRDWLIKRGADNRLYLIDFQDTSLRHPLWTDLIEIARPEDPEIGDIVNAGAGNFTQACGRTRRASVPARLRARGRGACGARSALRQHCGLHANSAATANWLRRSGTATRHACGLGWWGEQYQGQNVHSMRVVSTKWLDRLMDRASSTSNNGVPA